MQLYQQHVEEFKIFMGRALVKENVARELHEQKRHDMLVFKNRTCRVHFFPCVSISNMETIFSAAAAKNCPALGWNRTCAVPPCTRNTEWTTMSYWIHRSFFNIHSGKLGLEGTSATFMARKHASWVTFQYRISPLPSQEHIRSVFFGWKSNDVTWNPCPVNVCRENPGCKTF